MKCDFCGYERQDVKSRRNFPHGRKSKGIVTKTCIPCQVRDLNQEGKK